MLCRALFDEASLVVSHLSVGFAVSSMLKISLQGKP